MKRYHRHTVKDENKAGPQRNVKTLNAVDPQREERIRELQARVQMELKQEQGRRCGRGYADESPDGWEEMLAAAD